MLSSFGAVVSVPATKSFGGGEIGYHMGVTASTLIGYGGDELFAASKPRAADPENVAV
jgi:hypothetical protein